MSQEHRSKNEQYALCVDIELLRLLLKKLSGEVLSMADILPTEEMIHQHSASRIAAETKIKAHHIALSLADALGHIQSFISIIEIRESAWSEQEKNGDHISLIQDPTCVQ